MRCKAIRRFTWSKDGINALIANAGDEIDLPVELVTGLADEGFVKIISLPGGKKSTKPPENKAVEESPQNK